jgi:hypothetical protein
VPVPAWGWLLLVRFVIALASVWIALPIIILKSNCHLRDNHAEACETNKWLKYLADVTHEAEQQAGRS